MLTFPGYCTRIIVPTAHPVRYLAFVVRQGSDSLFWAHATLENYPTGTVKPLLLPKMKGSLNEGTGELRTIADGS